MQSQLLLYISDVVCQLKYSAIFVGTLHCPSDRTQLWERNRNIENQRVSCITSLITHIDDDLVKYGNHVIFYCLDRTKFTRTEPQQKTQKIIPTHMAHASSLVEWNTGCGWRRKVSPKSGLQNSHHPGTEKLSEDCRVLKNLLMKAEDY